MAKLSFFTLLGNRVKVVISRVGFPVFTTTTGEINAPIKFSAPVSTNSSGAGTLDISAAGITTLLSVSFTGSVASPVATNVPIFCLDTASTNLLLKFISVKSKNTNVGVLGASVDGLTIAASATGYVTVTGQ